MDVWPACLRYLEAELPPEDVLTWLKPLQADRRDDSLVLYAPNAPTPYVLVPSVRMPLASLRSGPLGPRSIDDDRHRPGMDDGAGHGGEGEPVDEHRIAGLHIQHLERHRLAILTAVQIAEDDAELITAEACDRVGAAHTTFQPPGGHLQQALHPLREG